MVKYFGYGILTLFIGFLTMLIFVGIFGQPGNGALTAPIFNAAMMALIVSILFLSAVIVVCTLILVNTMKNKE